MSFNYAISDSANLRLREKSSGNIVLYTPYANNTTSEFSSEQVYANAKGARAVRFDYNKQGKLTCEFEVFDLRWISILLGGSWKDGSVSLNVREVLTANASHTLTLTEAPLPGSLAVFKLKSDKLSHDQEQVLAENTTAENTYTMADKVITLNSTTGTEGEVFVVYYLKASDATSETIHIKTNDYPVSYEVVGDTMMVRKHDGVTEFIQFTCPNAKPQGALTLTMQAGGVTSLSAVFDLFGDENDDMMVITKL